MKIKNSIAGLLVISALFAQDVFAVKPKSKKEVVEASTATKKTAKISRAAVVVVPEAAAEEVVAAEPSTLAQKTADLLNRKAELSKALADNAREIADAMEQAKEEARLADQAAKERSEQILAEAAERSAQVLADAQKCVASLGELAAKLQKAMDHNPTDAVVEAVAPVVEDVENAARELSKDRDALATLADYDDQEPVAQEPKAPSRARSPKSPSPKPGF